MSLDSSIILHLLLDSTTLVKNPDSCVKLGLLVAPLWKIFIPLKRDIIYN